MSQSLIHLKSVFEVGLKIWHGEPFRCVIIGDLPHRYVVQKSTAPIYDSGHISVERNSEKYVKHSIDSTSHRVKFKMKTWLQSVADKLYCTVFKPYFKQSM